MARQKQTVKLTGVPAAKIRIKAKLTKVKANVRPRKT